MKDILIINTISKIHSAIVSFFSFIFLTLLFVFFILQNGLYLEDFSFGNINIKKLYLKWDQKLDLYIETLDVQPEEDVSETIFEKNDLIQYTKTFASVLNLFDSMMIQHFTYNGLNGELFYNSGKIELSVNSDSLHLSSEISLAKEFADIKLQQFTMGELSSNGELLVNLNTLESFSKVNFSTHNDANLTLYTSSNAQQIHYKVISHNNIKNIKAILQQIPFPQGVEYWVLDAIKLDNLEIISLNGTLDLSDLSNGYKHIYVKANANKLHYTYNQALDAVHTGHTELEFKDGVLFIRPKEATSYNFNLQNSWLMIDFTKREELLTLFLKFAPTLNADILHLLNVYKINLPIKQNTGIVDTNLTLAVNLRTIGVDAQGTFFAKKGNFNYLGQNIDVKDLTLDLNNYDISVKNMLASYKNAIDANVDIKYNAKESKGNVALKITRCNFDNTIHLTTKPLDVVYYIDQSQDVLTIKNSSWLYKNVPINLDKVDIPLDINTFELKVPTTYFSFKNISDGFVSGNINLKKLLADFDIDVLNFQYNGIKSTRSNTPLKLNFKDKAWTLKSNDDIYLNAVSSDVKISNLTLELDDEHFYVKNPTLSFGKFTQARVYVKYNLSTQQAHLSLNDLLIKNPENDKILYSNNKILLNASMSDEHLQISSEELRSTFDLDNTQWSLKLTDLETLYRDSEFLTKYHLNNGEVEIYKKLNDDTTRFNAKIHYPYALLYKDSKPVELYDVTGRFTKKQNLYIKVNDSVNVAVQDTIKINVHDHNISLPETIKWLGTLDTNESNGTSTNVSITALNSAIYLGANRYAIADNVTVQYHDNITTAQLQHADGKAGFKLDKNRFHLYGEGFNDKFMDKLFIFSKFKNGTFDFNIDGTLDKYNGTLLIQDSTLLDYAVLNNVLAFINTVPSLITFSIPGYSKNGLDMNHAYLKFGYEEGIFHINDMYMDSKELKISAAGQADIRHDTVDMTMNLKTDIASDASQIPVVGYILFDGKALSTSVQISGKLSDPQIESAIAQEVIVAPLNIIKRTLKLPFKIFE